MKKLIRVSGKVIGEIEDNVFIKPVQKSKHFMNILDAWGIDLEVFEKALEPNNSVILIKDKETRDYRTTANTFRNHGIIKDFGFRAQIFLPVKFFDADANQTNLL